MNNLSKGVRLTNGYVQVRIMHQGRFFHRNFGLDSSLARELASICAAEKYKEILMGKAGIRSEAKRMKFAQARELYYKRHYEDYKDPSSNMPRTVGAKRCAHDELKVLGRYFDGFYMDEIKVSDIKLYKFQRLERDLVANATFNRERGVLYSLFVQLRSWTAEELITPVKLPPENPCEFVPTLTANKRTRVPDTWEMASAYTWCQEHDPDLWYAIESALLTALRKQDLVALDGSLTVKGIQQKTGEKFDLPITLNKPVGLVNWRKRWDALRNAMGWAIRTPKHTTWHDLRHWAPTLLGEKGFSIKIIQSYTGHATEASAERYSNIRRKALEPAVDVVRQELRRIKGETE